MNKHQIVTLFRGITPKNFEAKKKLMTKKHDELVAARKVKEERLRALYSELDEVTHLNLIEDIAHLDLHERIAEKERATDEAANIFRNKLGMTLYDANCTK